MIALAVILLLLAAALVVAVLATGTSQQVLFDSAVGSFSTQPVWIFVAGVVATLLALLGFAALGRGTRRRVARRREMKRLRRVEKEQAAVRSERQSGRVDADEAAPVSPAVGHSAHDDRRTGYDQPDRHLVREPRTEHVDPQATEQLGRQPEASTSHTTSDGAVGLDEPARHRLP